MLKSSNSHDSLVRKKSKNNKFFVYIAQHRKSLTKKLVKEFKTQIATSNKLPSPYLITWRSFFKLFQHRKEIINLAFLPWLISVIISSVFTSLLPKSLLLNYSLSWFINFLLLFQYIYLLAFWTINKTLKQRHVSLNIKKWSSEKSNYFLKMLIWLLLMIFTIALTFKSVNWGFDFLQTYLKGQLFSNLITFGIITFYGIILYLSMYGFALWLFFIPYIIFHSRYSILDIKQLYDLADFKHELQSWIKIVKKFHYWSFQIFIANLLIALAIAGLAIIIAGLIYLTTSGLTNWLPFFIRSTIIQVFLMNGVIMAMVFAITSVLITSVCDGWWQLRAKKPK